MENIKIGNKVMCINSSESGALLRHGKIYTVKVITSNHESIRLAFHDANPYPRFRGWRIERFKKIYTKTSINELL